MQQSRFKRIIRIKQKSFNSLLIIISMIICMLLLILSYNILIFIYSKEFKNYLSILALIYSIPGSVSCLQSPTSSPTSYCIGSEDHLYSNIDREQAGLDLLALTTLTRCG